MQPTTALLYQSKTTERREIAKGGGAIDPIISAVLEEQDPRPDASASGVVQLPTKVSIEGNFWDGYRSYTGVLINRFIEQDLFTDDNVELSFAKKCSITGLAVLTLFVALFFTIPFDALRATYYYFIGSWTGGGAINQTVCKVCDYINNKIFKPTRDIVQASRNRIQEGVKRLKAAADQYSKDIREKGVNPIGVKDKLQKPVLAEIVALKSSLLVDISLRDELYTAVREAVGTARFYLDPSNLQAPSYSLAEVIIFGLTAEEIGEEFRGLEDGYNSYFDQTELDAEIRSPFNSFNAALEDVDALSNVESEVTSQDIQQLVDQALTVLPKELYAQKTQENAEFQSKYDNEDTVESPRQSDESEILTRFGVNAGQKYIDNQEPQYIDERAVEAEENRQIDQYFEEIANEVFRLNEVVDNQIAALKAGGFCQQVITERENIVAELSKFVSQNNEDLNTYELNRVLPATTVQFDSIDLQDDETLSTLLRGRTGNNPIKNISSILERFGNTTKEINRFYSQFKSYSTAAEDLHREYLRQYNSLMQKENNLTELVNKYKYKERIEFAEITFAQIESTSKDILQGKADIQGSQQTIRKRLALAQKSLREILSAQKGILVNPDIDHGLPDTTLNNMKCLDIAQQPQPTLNHSTPMGALNKAGQEENTNTLFQNETGVPNLGNQKGSLDLENSAFFKTLAPDLEQAIRTREARLLTSNPLTNKLVNEFDLALHDVSNNTETQATQASTTIVSAQEEEPLALNFAKTKKVATSTPSKALLRHNKGAHPAKIQQAKIGSKETPDGSLTHTERGKTKDKKKRSKNADRFLNNRRVKSSLKTGKKGLNNPDDLL